jgi:hypothetical protein
MARVEFATLQAALVGYTAELDKINAAMTAIRKQLGGRDRVSRDGQGPKPKHHMSAAGRRAITEAQKKALGCGTQGCKEGRTEAQDVTSRQSEARGESGKGESGESESNDRVELQEWSVRRFS